VTENKPFNLKTGWGEWGRFQKINSSPATKLKAENRKRRCGTKHEGRLFASAAFLLLLSVVPVSLRWSDLGFHLVKDRMVDGA
jgi:hypothetical protein